MCFLIEDASVPPSDMPVHGALLIAL